ncbi:unnamed protein product, partial [Rotaria sp. Silwood1]
IPLSWHYLPTNHGKEVVDSVGNSVKRLVYRVILDSQKCTAAATFIGITRPKV